MQEAKTQVTQLEAQQHILSPDLLQPVAERAEESINLTQANIARLEQVERWKLLALVPIWAFLMLMALLFAVKRLILDLQEKR